MTEYIRRAYGQHSTGPQNLYAALCEVTHPAADSLNWMVQPTISKVQIVASDAAAIQQLCAEHLGAIGTLLICSSNAAVLVLKVINHFQLPGIHTKYVDDLPMDGFPLWRTISRLLQG